VHGCTAVITPTSYACTVSSVYEHGLYTVRITVSVHAALGH